MLAIVKSIYFHEKLMVNRATATRYLNDIVKTGLIDRIKLGRTYYYMNIPLMNLFMRVSDSRGKEKVMPIESVSE